MATDVRVNSDRSSAAEGVTVPLRVVLCCTACDRAWEPDPAGWDYLAGTGYPACGGWTWIGELAEPPSPARKRAS